MKRQILVKVWQKRLTPEQALKELTRAGPKLNLDKEEKILELLLALRKKEITTTEAEEEIRYEQNREKYEKNHPCQI